MKMDNIILCGGIERSIIPAEGFLAFDYKTIGFGECSGREQYKTFYCRNESDFYKLLNYYNKLDIGRYVYIAVVNEKSENKNIYNKILKKVEELQCLVEGLANDS
jgi:hypothetical protein